MTWRSSRSPSGTGDRAGSSGSSSSGSCTRWWSWRSRSLRISRSGTGNGQLTTDIENVISTLAISFVPVAIGIAVLRYRLFDIDRLINRTIVYALLTVLLMGVYAALVVGLGAITGRTGNPVVIAGSTLVVAALFGPARRRIQAVIDRRFFRRRYDAELVLQAFSARLRDELDMESLSGELRVAVTDAVQPAQRDAVAPRGRWSAMSAAAAPGDARLVRWAVALFLGICVLYAVGFVFDVMNAERRYDLLAPFLFHALTISFPLVGVLIARRQPRNPITWILLGIGVAWGLGAAAEGYRTYALATSPGSLPAGDVVDAASSWLWVPGIVPAATLLLLLFPDGRLPSPRWRWVVWLTGVVLVTVSLAVTFAPATLESDGFPGLANPLGIRLLRPVFASSRRS